MSYILAINPGSTSTKISIFEGKKEIFTKTLRHSNEELAPYPNVIDQYQFRKDTIAAALVENNIDMKDIAAVVGRGGLLRPIASGVYEVNENMVADLSSAKYGEHASNLGGIIANAMAKEIPGCRAFIADPVVVDELCDVARISGHPKFPRKSIFHALNQKAIAKQYAAEVGKKYSDLNLIVAHMGGGTSIGAHKKGQIVDVNDALNGDGPFSPERSGSLTALDVVKACFSGEYTFDEMKKLINGRGGLMAHLGTNSFYEVEQNMAKGDAKSILITDAFLFQVAKSIGAEAAALCGEVDAILLTGGVAYGKEMMAQLADMVKFIAPVKVYPGEDEMGALAGNGLAVLEGTEEVKVY
ncbi:MAG: butyrate kinase [Bacteroidales bacterium]|jgi:butyrate kinase|nr:butyrate kinase [Bacteroidales bacterium]MBO7320474.1 butyrate kinase [Bacteroidales bacterium]MBO7763437.1 butyrate kinase [Bacteroidales bacterium]